MVAAAYRPHSVASCQLFCPGNMPHAFSVAPPPVKREPRKLMTDERRKQERVTVCLDATWHGRASKNGARAVDLSEGGCYIDSIAEVSVGEVLTLGLKMPDGKWLVLKGTVAHRTPRLGFGMRFLDLTDEQNEKIQFLLRRAKGEEETEDIFQGTFS